jgi:hypothetical protein
MNKWPYILEGQTNPRIWFFESLWPPASVSLHREQPAQLLKAACQEVTIQSCFLVTIQPSHDDFEQPVIPLHTHMKPHGLANRPWSNNSKDFISLDLAQLPSLLVLTAF